MPYGEWGWDALFAHRDALPLGTYILPEALLEQGEGIVLCLLLDIVAQRGPGGNFPHG